MCMGAPVHYEQTVRTRLKGGELVPRAGRFLLLARPLQHRQLGVYPTYCTSCQKTSVSAFSFPRVLRRHQAFALAPVHTLSCTAF